MAISSYSMNLAFVLSLSFTTSTFCSSSLLPTKPPKATASDLLSLLGTKQQASSVNSKIANDLQSYFKFLVPFTPACRDSNFGWSRRFLREEVEDDQFIWWPPEPVMELARLAVDSGGDPAAIHRTLDPTVLPFMILFTEPNFEAEKFGDQMVEAKTKLGFCSSLCTMLNLTRNSKIFEGYSNTYLPDPRVSNFILTIVALEFNKFRL